MAIRLCNNKWNRGDYLNADDFNDTFGYVWDVLRRTAAEHDLRLLVIESNLSIEGADDDIADIFISPDGLNATVELSQTTAGFDRTNKYFSNTLVLLNAPSDTIVFYTSVIKDDDAVYRTYTQNFTDGEFIYSVSADTYTYTNTTQTTFHSYSYYVIKYDDNTTATSPTYDVTGTTPTNNEFINPNPFKKVISITYYVRASIFSSTFDAYMTNLAYSLLAVGEPLEQPEDKQIVINYTSQKPTYCHLYLFDENNDIQNIGDVTYKFTDGINETAEYNPYEIVDLTSLNFTPTQVIINLHSTTESHIAKYVLLVSTT